MEAENVQEKKPFSFRCIVTNDQNVAERKAEACNCTEGKLKHRGSVMRVRSRMQALRSATHKRILEKQEGFEKH